MYYAFSALEPTSNCHESDTTLQELIEYYSPEGQLYTVESLTDSSQLRHNELTYLTTDPSNLEEDQLFATFEDLPSDAELVGY